MHPRLSLGLLTGFLLATMAFSQPTESDEQEIRRVLETSYVKGVFVDRNEELVRAGFHTDFMMPVVLEEPVGPVLDPLISGVS